MDKSKHEGLRDLVQRGPIGGFVPADRQSQLDQLTLLRQANTAMNALVVIDSDRLTDEQKKCLADCMWTLGVFVDSLEKV